MSNSKYIYELKIGDDIFLCESRQDVRAILADNNINLSKSTLDKMFWGGYWKESNKPKTMSPYKHIRITKKSKQNNIV